MINLRCPMSTEISVVPLTCYGVSLRPLKPKQRMFVIALFMNGMDQTLAAKEAGYASPKVKGSQLMKHPEIKRVVEKIQRKMSRESDLKLENVLERVADSVFRDFKDFVDEKGFGITDLNKLPDRLSAVIDGFKFHVYYDDEGNPVSQKVEYKLSPNAQALDMALKVLGGYAAEKTEAKHSISWDQLGTPPSNADEVDKIADGTIEAEYSLEDVEEDDE